MTENRLVLSTLMRDRRVVLLVILVTVALEAWVLLIGLGLGSTPLLVHDYQWYARLAENLLDHRTLGAEGMPPQPSYFRTPGLPLFMAAAFAVSGRSLIAFYAAQFGVLALTSYLIFLIADRLTERCWAVVAALLCACSPPMLMLCSTPTTEPLSGLFAAAILLGLLSVRDGDGGWVGGAGLGIAVGFLTLVRPAFTLLVVALAAYLLWWRPPNWRLTLRQIGGLVVGVCLVLVPWVVRNSQISGQPVGTSSGAGWSLYVSAQQYAGEVSYRLLKPEWTQIIEEYNRRYRAAEASVATAGGSPMGAAARREAIMDAEYQRDAQSKFRQAGPVRWLSDLPVRVIWLWSTAYSFPWRGIPHRVVQVMHVVLVGLVGIGLFATRGRWREHAHLLILPVYLTGLHLVFHVEARYTVPARPFLFIFAAVGLSELWRGSSWGRSAGYPVAARGDRGSS